jgi:hypothetical protein
MAQQSTYSMRQGPRDRQLRAGNDEREAVAEILRREHLAGRLDNDEFDERLGRCLTARTYAQLDELIADFPSAEIDRLQPRQLGWRRRPFPLPFMLLPLIVLAIVLSHGRAAWLVVPFVVWFVVGRFFWGYGWRSAAWRGYGRRF